MCFLLGGLFENNVSQWAWTWGQFIDHSIGLSEGGTEEMEITFDTTDPLEEFSNSSSNLHMTRSSATPGTGINTPREQTNTLSSVIDAWAVYAGERAN